MKLKHTVLTLSLFAAVGIAASGCDRGVNEIAFTGQKDASASETPATDTPNSDTIVPQDPGTGTTDSTGNTGTTGTGNTGANDPTNTGSNSGGNTGNTGTPDDPFCPAGMVSHGNPYLCCKVDDPNSCFFVEPGPKHWVRPDLNDLQDVVTVDPDPTPPSDTGTHGGLDDPKPVNCYHKDPYGRNERRVNQPTDGDSGVGPVRGCIMM